MATDAEITFAQAILRPGVFDGDYNRLRADSYAGGSVLGFVRMYSRQQHDRLLDFLGFVRAGGKYLSGHGAVPIVFVPYSRANAAAVEISGRPLIAVSEGLVFLLGLLHEYLVLRTVLRRTRELQGLGGSPDGKQHDFQFDAFFLHVVQQQLGPDAVPGLSSRNKLPQGLQASVEWGRWCSLLFVVLHEIGHVQLGHLRGGAEPEAARHELLLYEPTNSWKQEEIDADAFALAQRDDPKDQALILAATGFFLFLSVVDSAVGPDRGDSHPHSGNRLDHLLKSGTDSDERTRVMGPVQNVYKSWRCEGRTFYPEILRQIHDTIPDAPRALVAMRAYSELAETLLDEYRQRPESYKDALAPLMPPVL